ncbi:MAG: methionine gamma-lyase [Christensenellales bacterium]|nr:methionine gamma-lyase [Clostridium sp.]MCI6817069.1 methionine gamma-lyase [Clostridium sp.]MCI7012720.1 methionine gamma-lyase [Clostridium sp.]MDD5903494.1 methionine gamma-lyase [Clostridium sp.]MDD5982035.1 methionine gamma-lyase [Clostridium sp.]
MDKNSGFATKQIHVGKIEIPGIAPLATPIFQTSTFEFDSTAEGAARFAGEEEGYIYTRLGNPNTAKIAAKLAALEHAEAGMAMGSGMGAVSSVMWTVLHAGDHLLADDTLYGCTFAFFTHGLTRYGVEVTLVNFEDIDAVKAAIRPNTKAFYFETPTNPSLKLIDIEAIASLAHSACPDAKVIVDNTFSTPYIQTPIDLGADIVIHSATKYLNGHGDVIAGMAVGTKEFINECNMFGLKDMTGAVLGPFEAFLIDRGMKTLDIRVQKHCDNAMKVARFLESHPMVERVLYPGLESHPRHELAKKQMHNGFGGIITFELKCSREKSAEFVNSLKLCTIAVSLGDAETLIEHPATMTHSTYTPEELAQAGIGESMLRLSVGLEDAEDIIEDLRAGLDGIK